MTSKKRKRHNKNAAKQETKSQKPETKAIETQDPKITKELQEINALFSTIGFYPVAVDIHKREEAKNQILLLYSKGNDVIKQNVLHITFENITQYWDYRIPMNFGFFKSKFPEGEPKKLKLSTYRAMFNFYSSIEGSFYLIALLGEFRDTPSAKLLTSLFTYYSSIDSERFRMLRIAAIDALGESNSDYALRSLLDYADNIDSERLIHKIFSVLLKWDEKINSMEWDAAEKRKLKKSLDELISVIKNNEDTYVR